MPSDSFLSYVILSWVCTIILLLVNGLVLMRLLKNVESKKQKILLIVFNCILIAHTIDSSVNVTWMWFLALITLIATAYYFIIYLDLEHRKSIVLTAFVAFCMVFSPYIRGGIAYVLLPNIFNN